jgi:quinohemoprotein ethanol dehydrogenase
MGLHVRRRGRLAVTAAACAGVVMLAFSPGSGAASPAPRTLAPGAAAQAIMWRHGGNLNWRYYGNNLANTRFQDVDQINPSDVASLKPAWVFRTGVLDPAASFEDSPIVINGTMYVSTGHDDVFALNAATGAVRWAYHPEAQMPPLSELSICCGEDSRGVAYGDGTIFLARLDDTLVALNAHSGAVSWQATVARWQDRYSMTMAPQFADGEVIVGLAGGDFQTRDAVVAYDARTGRRLWTFYTTAPGPSWHGKSWQTGGGAVEGTPAVDPRLGLLYVGIGNAAPDLYGANRAGQNLYTDSLVALDLRTGRLRWYFQEVHHDLWDYDGSQAATLFNVTLGGRTYPAVGHCNKNGNYYILDRVTGKPLFPVTEKRVSTQPAWQHPWPTQPVSSVQPLTPMTVGPVARGVTVVPQYTPPQKKELAMQPGVQGGCSWPPAAYSPRTGDVYYDAAYLPVLYQSHPVSDNILGSTFAIPVPGAHPPYSVVGATSTATGKVVWKIKTGTLDESSMAIAGNLLFYGEDTGQFHAVDASTGDTLWTFSTDTSVPGAGGADGAPTVYVVHGREYVVDVFGGNVIDESPVGDAVVAFALPGPLRG